MQRVALRFGARPGWAYLRGLRGDDEESVEGTETLSAIALIDRLLVDAPGAAVRPGHAAELTSADRDRVLAAIYLHELGARIASAPLCPACGARFELDFDLRALLGSLGEADAGAGAGARDASGAFVAKDGTRFRLPSGADELCAAGEADPAAALWARCRLDGAADADALSAAMAELAPLVEAELGAACPECGAHHEVRFDIQSFLLGQLIAERRQRTGDVHQLARTFGWSLTEILSLSRSQRRVHLELVDRAGV